MKVYLITIFMYASLLSCGQQTFEERIDGLIRESVPTIKVEELKDNLEGKIILDTRAKEEYEVSHLDGASFINYNRFKAKDVKQIPLDAEIIVYCSIGYRSEKIGEKLQKLGFSNVKNLYGGIFEWKNQGMKVVNENGVATDSVHTYNKSWSKWLTNGIKIYD